jgi:hypothetical protein
MKIWDVIGWFAVGLVCAEGAHLVRLKVPAEQIRLVGLLAVLPLAALVLFVAAQSRGAVVGFAIGAIGGQFGYQIVAHWQRRKSLTNRER